jgi:hypothetical protein
MSTDEDVNKALEKARAAREAAVKAEGERLKKEAKEAAARIAKEQNK